MMLERYRIISVSLFAFRAAVLALAVWRVPAHLFSEKIQKPALRSPEQVICYDLELSDPVEPDLPKQTYSLQLNLNADGFPKEYQLSLRTDVCLERVCKFLIADLFWDALGQYSRLECAEQSPLTKSNHDEFLQEDYDRLSEILKDKRSILGTHPLSFFAVHSNLEEKGVDAVTAATPQAVQDAVVSGAAYTSWVLWHWVNGEIEDKLLALTLPQCSPEYLNHCLLSDDPRFVRFAFEHLLNQKLYDVFYREACFQILENSGRANCQLALQYLTALPQDSDELNARLIKLIGINAGSSRLILDRFEKLPNAPSSLWIQMAVHLGQLNVSYDVNAVLDLLKRRAGDSEAVRLEVAKLLQSDDRFIAERAQEFMGEQ